MVPRVNSASKYILKPTTLKKFATTLTTSGALLPVILLETTVTGGRSYQAYKRGGFTEARERLCEESLGAVFWLWGVTWFNKLGDLIGKKLLKIDNPQFPLAKDALRDPFGNMLRNKGIQNQKNKLIAFKTIKVVGSVLAACAVLGFAVPKFNQAITKKLLSRDKAKKEAKENNNITKQQPVISIPMAKPSSNVNFAQMEKLVNRHNNTKNPAFGAISAEAVAAFTNNLENHAIYKLLATDAGVLSGRTYSARNKDEKIEILFRDGASIYFYLRATNDIKKLLDKYDGFGGKISKIDPTTATTLHNIITRPLLMKKGGSKVTLAEAEKYLLGTNPDLAKANAEKITYQKGDVISLDDFLKQAQEKGLNLSNKTIAKAKKMAGLQPEIALDNLGQAGKIGKVLSKQQVTDIFNDGILSRPDVLRRIMQQKFNGKLLMPEEYIDKKAIEELRTQIDDYAKVIIEYAKKNNLSEITPDVLLKVNKLNLRKLLMNLSAGIAVSALFLSTLIPKAQYWITKMRTGSDKFPGVEGLEK